VATRTPVELGQKPVEVPIACTLEPGALPDRLADWRAVLDRASTRTDLPDGSLRLELADDVDLAGLAELVAAEQACCSFFAFAITIDTRGVALEVSAPDGAAEIVASLFGAAT